MVLVGESYPVCGGYQQYVYEEEHYGGDGRTKYPTPTATGKPFVTTTTHTNLHRTGGAGYGGGHYRADECHDSYGAHKQHHQHGETVEYGGGKIGQLGKVFHEFAGFTNHHGGGGMNHGGFHQQKPFCPPPAEVSKYEYISSSCNTGNGFHDRPPAVGTYSVGMFNKASPVHSNHHKAQWIEKDLDDELA